MLAALLASCASGPPKGPAPYVISLRPSSAAVDAPAAPMPPLRVDDRRGRPDPAQVGEVLAPGGGVLPPMGGAGGGPAAAVGVAIVLLAVPAPTGQFLRVRDPADLTRAIESALVLAWQKSGRELHSGLGLEAEVRAFWIAPSWTTRCELSIELRLHGADGAPLWQQTLDVRVQEFQGLFAVESFEHVATLALDKFVDQAAAAFASPAFVAASAGH